MLWTLSLITASRQQPFEVIAVVMSNIYTALTLSQTLPLCFMCISCALRTQQNCRPNPGLLEAHCVLLLLLPTGLVLDFSFSLKEMEAQKS